MTTRRLGPDGPQVGPIGLGCMGMTWAYVGEGRDDDASIATIHRALELGATLLDTADMYGPYTNEELVGRALRDRRDDAVLATKCGLVAESRDPIVMRRDGSPDHVRAALDASLRRLGVDHVDLWQLHRVDPKVPLEETWGAMAEAVAAGKARAIGMSEATVEQLDRAHAIHPVASVQSELSLWTREPLTDIVPWCAAQGVAFLPFAPLGRGFLTGRLAGQDFASADFRSRLPRFQRAAMARNRAIIDAVDAVAARHDAVPGQVALAWLLAQGEHVIPIPGTTKVAHLEENAAAAGVRLTETDLCALEALPAPSGSRY